MENNINSSPENLDANNNIEASESNDKSTMEKLVETYKTKTGVALSTLALATSLNVMSPAEASETSIPENAVPVEFINGEIDEIPFEATKVDLGGAYAYVWKNEQDNFSMQMIELDNENGTDDFSFEANVEGENYVFSIVGDGTFDQTLIAEKSPERESDFGINYDRMTRGNFILKNIMLSAEDRLAEYFKENKGYNDSQISDELSGIARLFGRDTIDKITYEDFKTAYPEILTSLSYLNQNEFPDLNMVGLTESTSQNTERIGIVADRYAENADRLNNISNRLSNIREKLSGE